MLENKYDYVPVVIDIVNLIILVDSSSSMKGHRIATINHVVPEIINIVGTLLYDRDEELSVRIIAFNDKTEWKVGSVSEGVLFRDFIWQDLKATGRKNVIESIREANDVLHTKNLVSDPSYMRVLRPVVILITDGYCNPSDHADYIAAIDEMKKKFSGDSGKDKITRIAIGVDDFNRKELEEFASLARLNNTGYRSERPLSPLVFSIDEIDDLYRFFEEVYPPHTFVCPHEPIEFPADPDEDDEWL